MIIDFKDINLEDWFKEKENRKLVRKYLPKHFAKTIAAKEQCSYNTVYQFMAGNYFRLTILVSILELAMDNIANQSKLENKALDMINKISEINN